VPLAGDGDAIAAIARWCAAAGTLIAAIPMLRTSSDEADERSDQ
jgi:hypothetical protein